MRNANAGLDLAIESFSSHGFLQMGHKFYLRTIEGTLKPQQEEKLRQLGVKVRLRDNHRANVIL